MPLKQKFLKILNHKISRFASIGLLNTILDFGIFNALRVATHTTGDQISKLVVINIISVTVVVSFSFYMNSHYVFRHDKASRQHAALFILVTLIGVYLVQQPLFSLGLHYETGLANWLYSMGTKMSLNISPNFYLTNVAKAFATLGSMTWNYNFYNLVVFRKKLL